MRQAILAAIIGCVGLTSAVRADSWYGPRYPYHVYYSQCPKCPYGYKTWGYGITAHAAFGPNSYRAPGVRSFTGPGEYIYAGSMNAYRRPAVSSTTTRLPADALNPPEVIPSGDAPYPTTKPSAK